MEEKTEKNSIGKLQVPLQKKKRIRKKDNDTIDTNCLD